MTQILKIKGFIIFLYKFKFIPQKIPGKVKTHFSKCFMNISHRQKVLISQYENNMNIQQENIYGSE